MVLLYIHLPDVQFLPAVRHIVERAVSQYAALCLRLRSLIERIFSADVSAERHLVVGCNVMSPRVRVDAVF